MASTPTDPGTPGGSDPGAGRGGPGYGAYTAMGRDIARMPIPGNAEFLFWLVLEIVFAIIWIVAKTVDTRFWVTVTTVTAFAYLISRGIAKASRVLEQ
jgi:hypothetical protein